MLISKLSRRSFLKTIGVAAGTALLPTDLWAAKKKNPNVIIIYADDLGYGDVSCYGATKLSTPNIDKLAAEGIRFTNAHSSSATCTPSRYAMLTGQYPWRKKGTGVLPGNANLIIEPGSTTLPSIMQNAGYKTGVVGKWHLGLGNKDIDWNGKITPGPLEIGFDHCFLIPATGDRVPCVYVEDHHIVGLDPADPVEVSFGKPIGNEPTGKNNPELLKMHPSHGHNNTIINGVSRIGYMSGGKKARWVDEDMADTITGKANSFIEKHKDEPFFLYFSTHDIHVPRIPHPRFAGKTGMGPRGDAIIQLDWCTGEIIKTLDRLNLTDNTIVIFTSDNGPVLDDGYKDDAVSKNGDHKPAGPLRGGKYSSFDGGTRVPFIVRWPGKIKTGQSDALLCQIDFMASFANLTGQKLANDDAPDSIDVMDAMLGKTEKGRDHLIEHARTLSLIKGNWKIIEPRTGAKKNANTNTELGGEPKSALYDLDNDLGEKNNIADKHPEIVKEMTALLNKIKTDGRSRK